MDTTSIEETALAPAAPAAPPAPRRPSGHRGTDVRDTVAELTARAQELSLEAGSKIAGAMKDVINAAAGIAGFAIESARDLTQYMVRRGQMSQEEADKLIREAEAAHARRTSGTFPALVVDEPEPVIASITPAVTGPVLVVVEEMDMADEPAPAPRRVVPAKPAASRPSPPVARKMAAKPAARASTPVKAPVKVLAKPPAKAAVRPGSKARSSHAAQAKPVARPAARPAAKASAKTAAKKKR